MYLQEYQTMADMEATYWWHVGKKQIIHDQLSRLSTDSTPLDILNIGCGTGGTVATISQFGRVTNVDTSAEAISYCEHMGIPDAIQIDGRTLPFESESFDLALALDVLEHIEDDNQALTEWRRTLKHGGKLLLTVPAYQWLWSGHDVSLNHYRRYRLSHLKQQLKAAGYKVTKGSYAVASFLPMIAGYRLVQKATDNKEQTSYVMLPKPINSAFGGVLKVESSLLKSINLPFGTTVLAVAERV